MLAIAFTFPVGRYHATPWGRHVNEADVAWPPEPWRILRALIAAWHRKVDPTGFPYADLADLIDRLAEEPPQFCLPEDVIHSHTRHYMPQRDAGKTTLVFDAFAHMPASERIVVLWPSLTLDDSARARLALLVSGLAYLGRAESWVEADLLDDVRAAADAAQVNCCPICMPPGTGIETVRVIAPLPAAAYQAVRLSHLDRLSAEIQAAHKGTKPLSAEKARAKVEATALAQTLPDRLIDAIALDTSVLQAQGWSRPPASRDVLYARPSLSPLPRHTHRARSTDEADLPTVARFVLAGRPRPRLEDAVKIGELMRLATLAKYGWAPDPATGRKRPLAPPVFSGRDQDTRQPLNELEHTHAFWLPEDADGDGEIDHITVFARNGFDAGARAKLDSVTRLWLEKKQRDDAGEDGEAAAPQRQEWRLALEGFGKPEDFEKDCAFLKPGQIFTSITPFLSAGHLKPGPNPYQREIHRLLRLRRLVQEEAINQVIVTEIQSIKVGSQERRPIQFHRFRSTRGEQQPEATGAFLQITLPHPLNGPLCLGYGSHFGLGLFKAVP